ncbi:MAG: hypothetical protein ACYCO9_03730 [Streptosporangiaceae bacterium]
MTSRAAFGARMPAASNASGRITSLHGSRIGRYLAADRSGRLTRVHEGRLEVTALPGLGQRPAGAGIAG